MAQREHRANSAGLLADQQERIHERVIIAFVFHVVLVAFEGPDRYSFVGGLATRMTDLSGALLDRGHRVHHLFVGDPSLPTKNPSAPLVNPASSISCTVRETSYGYLEITRSTSW